MEYARPPKAPAPIVTRKAITISVVNSFPERIFLSALCMNTTPNEMEKTIGGKHHLNKNEICFLVIEFYRSNLVAYKSAF